MKGKSSTPITGKDQVLYVVGIGPGNPAYVVPKALELIRQSPVLVGSRRALLDFAQETQKVYAITAQLEALCQSIEEELQEHDVVVMVSGDTGYYSLLPYLKKKFPHRPIEVVPGISSMTFAFARLGESWHDADLMSFHGRQPKSSDLAYQEGRKLGFLTDPAHNPAYIAKVLQEHGWPAQTEAAALERLSYDDESIVRGSLSDIERLEGFGHSVMVVLG